VHLAERIEAIDRRYALPSERDSGRYPHGVVATGLKDVDDALQGGLVVGALHEWFGITSPSTLKTNDHRGRFWTPPVIPLVHLAWRFLEAALTPMRVVWIEDRCFPYPHVMTRGSGMDRRLLDNSFFVSPRRPGDRLWAIDLSIRSPAVGLVIADGSSLDMAATRRLQLAAKSYGTPVLIVRPPWEQVEFSAAQTRWLVGWEPSSPYAQAPRWSVELLRCKGVHVDWTHHSWVLEWNRVSCTLNLSTPLAYQKGHAETIAASEERAGRFARSA